LLHANYVLYTTTSAYVYQGSFTVFD